MENFKEVFGTILDFIGTMTPFILLFAGWWWATHQKKDDRQYAKEEKRDAEAEKKLNDTLDKTLSVVDGLDKKLDEVIKDNEKLRTDYQNLAMLNKLNGQYTHELAQLVMTLAEGLRDQHLDGNITHAVEKYRSFESDALGAFVTGDYLSVNSK